MRSRPQERHDTAGTTGGLPEVSAEDQAARRTRRRFARRQWRRRWLAWRRVLAVVVVLAVLGVAVWAVWFSSMLSVQSVEVTGTSALGSGQVRRAAGVELGKPLVSVNLGAVRARIAALAAVEHVDVSRKWPDEVLIDVTERTPIAVIDFGGRLRGLDKDGVVFLDYKSAPPGLPKVTTPYGTSAKALREAAKVVAALPPGLTKIIDHVAVKTVDQITLSLTDGRTVVWGSSADSAEKAVVLQALLKHDAKTYDVSVPGQPTTAG
ncbi:FtsQ-type POTRA domain-containing protein [Nocardioides sp. CER19]|uniref:cell division protein FtsQ/DivIB n=1 Tax=Nocardioides sp. CER19 TaxID=3038538 RepID=UPI002448D8C2|nr:FtsQ-type POTRA domain-containing protein [Nocardioides sp. CER19]MDH2416699.1 FtsQ-type POTRA domain-containing protein [Nocardioides sp. CER19]